MDSGRYADDALNVQNGTQPEEVREFVKKRSTEPIKIQEKIVWNFNNHPVKEELLREQSRKFQQDRFVIPFQATGAWGYMVQLLPTEIKEAEILAFDRKNKRYNPYPNFLRYSSQEEEDATREWIKEQIEGL